MLSSNSASLLRLVLLLLVLSASCLSSVGAAVKNSSGIRPADVPSPMDYPGACHRESVSNSAICDIDDMLTKDSKDVIEGIMNEIASKGHGEAAACIVYKMAPSFISQSGGTIEKAGDLFAHQVFDKWGVGDKDKQDGVLLFVSIIDRMVYISTGSGVDALFPTQVTDGVVEHMKPYLRDNNFGRAMEAGMTEIGLILSKEAIPSSFWSVKSKKRQRAEPVELTWQGTFWALGFLSAVGVCIYVAFRRFSAQRDRLRNGQAALNRLLRDVGTTGTGSGTGTGAAAGAGDRFHADSCPICLEDFAAIPAHTDNQEAGSSATSSTSTDANINGAAMPGVASSETTPLNAGSATPASSARRAVMLQCEHQFCFDCISAYLRTPEGKNCPICRAPVDTESTAQGQRPQHHRADAGERADAGLGAGAGAGADTAGFFGEGQGAGLGFGGGGFGGGNSCSFRAGRMRSRTWAQRQPEMIYRLARMRALYPEVMPVDTMTIMSAAVQSDAATFTAAIQARATQVTTMITDQDRRSSMRSSGSSGSFKRSFGGGRSSRGGGGRW